MTFTACDQSGLYRTTGPVSREDIIRFAHTLLSRRFRNRRKITSSDDVHQWLVLKLAEDTRESFGMILLSQQHHLLGYHTLFTGTLNQTMVYPREIVALALTHHAAAVILVHNHPSGEPEPSQAKPINSLPKKLPMRFHSLISASWTTLLWVVMMHTLLQSMACFELPGLIHINHARTRPLYPFTF